MSVPSLMQPTSFKHPRLPDDALTVFAQAGFAGLHARAKDGFLEPGTYECPACEGSGRVGVPASPGLTRLALVLFSKDAPCWACGGWEIVTVCGLGEFELEEAP